MNSTCDPFVRAGGETSKKRPANPRGESESIVKLSEKTVIPQMSATETGWYRRRKLLYFVPWSNCLGRVFFYTEKLTNGGKSYAEYQTHSWKFWRSGYSSRKPWSWPRNSGRVTWLRWNVAHSSQRQNNIVIRWRNLSLRTRQEDATEKIAEMNKSARNIKATDII